MVLHLIGMSCSRMVIFNSHENSINMDLAMLDFSPPLYSLLFGKNDIKTKSPKQQIHETLKKEILNSSNQSS